MSIQFQGINVYKGKKDAVGTYVFGRHHKTEIPSIPYFTTKKEFYSTDLHGAAEKSQWPQVYGYNEFGQDRVELFALDGEDTKKFLNSIGETVDYSALEEKPVSLKERFLHPFKTSLQKNKIDTDRQAFRLDLSLGKVNGHSIENLDDKIKAYVTAEEQAGTPVERYLVIGEADQPRIIRDRQSNPE